MFHLSAAHTILQFVIILISDQLVNVNPMDINFTVEFFGLFIYYYYYYFFNYGIIRKLQQFLCEGQNHISCSITVVVRKWIFTIKGEFK